MDGVSAATRREKFFTGEIYAPVADHVARPYKTRTIALLASLFTLLFTTGVKNNVKTGVKNGVKNGVTKA